MGWYDLAGFCRDFKPSFTDKPFMDKKRKDTIKKVVSWSLTALAVLFMGWYIYKNRDILNLLRTIHVGDILLIAVLQPINIIIGGVINKLIIDSIDQKIKLSDSLMLQFANNFVNRFIAQGGAVYRSAYLKTKFDFPISKFLASIGGVYIINLMANATIGIFLVVFFFLTANLFNIYMLGLFLALLLGMITLLLIKPKFQSERWFFKKLTQVVNGWYQIKGNRALIIKMFGLSAISLINASLIVFIAYRALDVDIQFMNSFFYSTISSLSNIINLTPGGLGINEAILMFASDVIGVSSEVILLGSLMLRAISMITTFTIGGISYMILNYRLQKTGKSREAIVEEEELF
jgi:uncharacterized membrane protein YbhN (UPF0104 family)